MKRHANARFQYDYCVDFWAIAIESFGSTDRIDEAGDFSCYGCMSVNR